MLLEAGRLTAGEGHDGASTAAPGPDGEESDSDASERSVVSVPSTPSTAATEPSTPKFGQREKEGMAGSWKRWMNENSFYTLSMSAILEYILKSSLIMHA